MSPAVVSFRRSGSDVAARSARPEGVLICCSSSVPNGSPHSNSLRGIAAMAVVIGHATYSFQFLNVFDGTFGDLVRWTPLGLVVGGRQAVLLFFVLSGYALTCAVIGDRRFTYPRFLVRRTCRIWLPYAATILLAAAVWSAIPPHALPGREAFLEFAGRLSPDTRLILGHLAMTGEASALSLDPPAWSLVHEMRISAVFPLLLLCCRLGLPLALAAAAALHAAAGVAVGCEARPCTPYQAATVAESFLLTAYMTAFFVLGIAIALRRPALERWFGNMPGWLKTVLWIGSLASLTLGYRAHIATDAVYGLGSAVLIALVVTTPGAQKGLARGPFPWLGRISYSLYLTHWVVMVVAAHLLRGTMPDLTLPPVLVAVSLLVAAVAHALIEAPAMRLGRLLTSGRLALVPGHDVDLVDLHLARQPRRRGLGDQAAPQLFRHGLHIGPDEAQLLGDLPAGEVQPHEVEAEHDRRQL